MKWLILAALFPAAAMAEGTRHGLASQLGAVKVELNLSSGIAVDDLLAALRFQTYFKDQPSARRRDETVPLILDKVNRRGSSVSFVYRVAEDYAPAATDFWNRNGIPEGITASFPLCRTPTPARRETMSWRISFPGVGYLPPDTYSAADMRELLAEIEPCAPPERAD